MTGQLSGYGAGTSVSFGTGSDTAVALNVKTLDSQMYSFRVEKNMPVASFKEKIANEIGLPVAQQRLIFRGKVLKDEHLLSEYHVENGHTLHLVERQPAQSLSSSISSFGETNANSNSQGSTASAGAPHNHIGQISHSVVLRTFNVGDQGESVVPDLTRVVGAVLSSLGINNQNAATLPQNFTVPNASGQAPHGNGTEAAQGDAGSQAQGGNQTQTSQPSPALPFQLPLAGVSMPLPSLHPIPDSLNTMVEFMNRMEGVLSRNGNQRDQSTSDMTNQQPIQFPSNSGGLPMPEALSIVLRRAERLLGGGAIGSLSHIAGRLEQESSSTDPSVRSQIQSELVQVGLAMQHLGALFLELGRAILTARMGQSPAESVINAGPAVYISPLGPNPIMVQPFPLQTSPHFNTAGNSSPNPGPLGPIGIIGSAPRHVNIHIHAGTAPVSLVGARAGNAGGSRESTQGEHAGGTSSAESASTRAFPMRNVIATAVSSHPTAISVSSAQPVIGVSGLQPPNSASLSSVISEINSRLRNLASSRTENQPSSGQQQNLPAGLDRGSDVGPSVRTHEANIPRPQAQTAQCESQLSGSDQSVSKIELPCSVDASSSNSSGKVRLESENATGDVSKSVETSEKPDAAKDVPLGLGLGCLWSKRQTQQPQTQPKSGNDGPSDVVRSNQNSNAIAAGQQVLQSLSSLRSSSASRSISSVQSPIPTPQGLADGAACVPSDENQQTSTGQLDVMGMMSQVLQNPAFNSFLSGIAGQTGLGSPDDMRSMFQQLTQDPESRNTINQFAQRMNREALPNLLAGSGRSQGGGLDLSGMIQQMMPLVSCALSGGNSTEAEPFAAVDCESQPRYANKRSLSELGTSFEQSSQINVQEVVQRITQQSAPQEIMRAVVQNSLQLLGGSDLDELVDELCGDDALANDFMGTLCHDLRQRFQGGSSGFGGEC